MEIDFLLCFFSYYADKMSKTLTLVNAKDGQIMLILNKQMQKMRS